MGKDFLDLGGRVALITGAGQGIGRQIALHFAGQNCGGVAVNDYVLERAESVAEEIRAAGANAFPIQGDVTDFENVQSMVQQINSELGPIGILINNAGNSGATPIDPDMSGKPFWEIGPAGWARHIGVNFFGVLNCTSAVIPTMISRQAPGRIITIISEAARWGDVGLEIYSGAKAGAAGFMRGVARAMGKYEITANCISIGATATPTIAGALEDPDYVKKMMSRYIIRRVGQPEDVANMALFLASDSSSWISGQTYPVNGGFTVNL